MLELRYTQLQLRKRNGGQLYGKLAHRATAGIRTLATQVAAAAGEAWLHPHAAEAHDGQRHPMMIDAPVSGGVPGAQAGSLTFMVREADGGQRVDGWLVVRLGAGQRDIAGDSLLALAVAVD